MGGHDRTTPTVREGDAVAIGSALAGSKAAKSWLAPRLLSLARHARADLRRARALGARSASRDGSPGLPRAGAAGSAAHRHAAAALSRSAAHGAGRQARPHARRDRAGRADL